MRSSIKLATTIFAVVLLSSCYGNEYSRLFAVEKDGLYGYTNTKGDTVIDCVYPLVYTETISQIGFVAGILNVLIIKGYISLRSLSMITARTIPVKDFSGL